MLCLLPIAIVAGIFLGFCQLDTLSDKVVAEFVAEAGSTDLLIIIGAVQTVGYALFCAFFGYILTDQIGLWKAIKFEKKALSLRLRSLWIGASYSAWIIGLSAISSTVSSWQTKQALCE